MKTKSLIKYCISTLAMLLTQQMTIQKETEIVVTDISL